MIMDKLVVDLDQILNDFDQQTEASRVLGEINSNSIDLKANTIKEEPGEHLIVLDDSEPCKDFKFEQNDQSPQKEKENQNGALNQLNEALPSSMIDLLTQDSNEEQSEDQPFSLLMVENRSDQLKALQDALESENQKTKQSKSTLINTNVNKSKELESCESNRSDLLSNWSSTGQVSPSNRQSESQPNLPLDNTLASETLLNLLDNCPIQNQTVQTNSNERSKLFFSEKSEKIEGTGSLLDLSIENCTIGCDNRTSLIESQSTQVPLTHCLTPKSQIECDSNVIINQNNPINQNFVSQSDSFVQMDLLLSANQHVLSNVSAVPSTPLLSSSTASSFLTPSAQTAQSTTTSTPSTLPSPSTSSSNLTSTSASTSTSTLPGPDLKDKQFSQFKFSQVPPERNSSDSFPESSVNNEQQSNHFSDDNAESRNRVENASPSPSQFQPLPSLENSIGYVKPYWMLDQDAPNCLNCGFKFTIIKRRHHCRACGKVYCNVCSNYKAKLPYLDFKEVRVCKTCYQLLDHVRIEQQATSASVAHSMASNAASPNASPYHRPSLSGSSTVPPSILSSSLASTSATQSQAVSSSSSSGANQVSESGYIPVPSNPLEYCSAVPPTQQATTSYNQLPVVFVPVSVLRRPDKPKRESNAQKQVIFSDGIRPGGDLTETPSTSGFGSANSPNALPFPPKVSPKANKRFKLPQFSSSHRSNKICLFLKDSIGELPPLVATDQLNETSTLEDVMRMLSDPLSLPNHFQLSKNLLVQLKRTRLDCCTNQLVWVLTTVGLSSVGQDEVLVVLETDEKEVCIPRDLFRLVRLIYDYANRGQPFSDLNHILFEDGLFSNPDIGGFVFFRPNLHCLQQIHVPPTPFLVALLISKAEVPWAKIFPLRLLLRLGADAKQYPSPIVSIRTRRPCFEEIGHTIMNVLADFRNYQYTMPFIPGLFVQMRLTNEHQEILISICKSRHEQVVKALSSSNEHVLAFGASFNQRASAHFTCSKSDDGQYRSELFTTDNLTCEYRQLVAQSVSDSNQSNKTNSSSSTILHLKSAFADIGLSSDSTLAANFVVFSGALKSSTGLTAKFSVVEDGFLIQITSNMLEQLKAALKDCKKFTINCGAVDSQMPDEVIKIVWEEEDKYFNVGVQSLIDEMPLNGVPSIRIFNGTDCVGEKYLIRWIEVFFIKYDRNKRRNDFNEPTRMANLFAHSLCVALTPHLEQLYEGGVYRVALRVTLSPDNLGYEVSSTKGQLQSIYANELDNALIPIIMGNFGSSVEETLVMELLFHLLEK